MKRVVWFQEVGKGDIGMVDGKGANLGGVKKAGIPVPPGFIVTSLAHFHFLKEAGLRPKISQLLSTFDPNDGTQLQNVAAEIRYVCRMTDFKTNEYSNLKGGANYAPEEENPMVGYRGASRDAPEDEAFQLEIEAIKRLRRGLPQPVDHYPLRAGARGAGRGEGHPGTRRPAAVGGVQAVDDGLGALQRLHSEAVHRNGGVSFAGARAMVATWAAGSLSWWRYWAWREAARCGR